MAAVFAYPLGFAVWMSFHDYFFTAPGRARGPPVRRAGQLPRRSSPTRTCGTPSSTSAIFLVDQRAADRGVCRWCWPRALNAAIPVPHVLPAPPTTSRTSRPASPWSACGCSCSTRTAWSTRSLGPLAPDPSWLVNSHLAMPVDRALRDLEAARLLHPAVPGGAAERAEGALRVGLARRRRHGAVLPGRHGARRAPGDHSWSLVLATVTGANLFTEPYLLTGGGGPDGASTSPVLLMYQRGIEQGHPDAAAAIGVILVVLITAISLGYRRLLERD